MTDRRSRKKKLIKRKVRRVLIFLALLLFVLFLLIRKDIIKIKPQIIERPEPELTLEGKTEITLLKGEEFVEPGYSAKCGEKDCTEKIKTEGEIDYNTPGEYQLYYLISDDGHFALKNRKIIVEESYNFETSDIEFYIRSLENYIEEKEYDMSLGYYNFQKDYTYEYRSKESYYGASTIKPVAALYAYENLNLTHTQRSLIKSMIYYSDNNAYTSIVDEIGLEKLKSYGEKMGLTDFLTDENNTYYTNTTVENQLIIWKKLYDFFENNKNGEELESYFDNDVENNIKFNDKIETLHKYGSWGVIYHDVGIIKSNSPYIIVVLTNEGGKGYGKKVKDISEKIYNLNKLIEK